MDEGSIQPEKRIDAVLERIPGWATPAVLLGVPAIMAFLSLVFKGFYANVVWKYYWGPIVADGSEVGPMGLERYGVVVHGGYNVVNTLSWVVLLFVCVVGIAQLLYRFKVPMNPQMIMAATAWVITGSIIHVLQDAQLFGQPLEFFMITPPVWLIFGAFGVGSMILGVYYRHIHQSTGSLERAFQKAWFHIVFFVIIYAALWYAQWDQIVVYINPIIVALAAAAAFFIFRTITERKGRIEPWVPVATFSIGWFLTALVYYGSYWQDPWPGRTPDFEFKFAVWFVPSLAGAVTGVVYLVARQLLARGKEGAAAFLQPINLFLVFSQMVDAFSTSVGVDLGSYSEKHVLSEAVRHGFERLARTLGWAFGEAHPTFIGFASVKLGVSLLVIYAIDVTGKEDTKRMPTLMNLVKMAVIIVGIGPGVRNTLRMTLGI